MKVHAARRLTALPVILALVLCLVCPVPAANGGYFQSFPEEPVSLEYGSPEQESVQYEKLRVKLEALSSADTQAEKTAAVALLRDFMAEVDHLSTCASLCMVDYYREPAVYSKQYDQWVALAARVESESVTLFQKLLDSPFGDLFTEELGADTVEELLDTDALNETQQAMVVEDQALQKKFWERFNAQSVFSYEGTDWDYDKLSQITSDEMDGETYLAITGGLARARGNTLAEVLAEMVPLRNKLARSLDFDNYAEYAYSEIFGRDYTLAEAEAFHTQVKKTFVPLLEDLSMLSLFSKQPNMYSLGFGLTLDTTDGDAVLDAIAPYMDDVSDDYARVFAYMRENKLVDLDTSESKLAGAFTVQLPEYGSAYLYGAPTGSYQDVSTAIHEFGHYAAFSLAEAPSDCYDLLEIHSQGLEALFLPYADEILGESLADPFRFMTVYQFVSSVVQGALFDEFQTALYRDGDLTPAEMHALFARLSDEYDARSFYPIQSDGLCYTWTEIPHTFERPCYYISYAASAVPALELVLQSEDDYQDTVKRFLTFVALGDTADYREALHTAGLSDPFAAGTLKTISDGLYGWLDKMIPAVDYSDVQNHWSARFVDTMSRLNVFQDFIPDSLFQPDRTATRGETVSMLWRMLSGETLEHALIFDDVTGESYCSGAVEWCARFGLMEGYDTGAFGVEDPVLREQAALVLCKAAAMVGLDTARRADLSVFPDGADTEPWAADAMSWAVACGLFGGNDDGTLNPHGQITRAELATVMSNLLG